MAKRDPADSNFRFCRMRSLSDYRAAGTREAGVSIGTRSMNARSFFDTNVLVYADDDDAPAKQRVARDLWHEHRRGGTGRCFAASAAGVFCHRHRKTEARSAQGAP